MVWRRHTGDYVLIILMPALLFFRLCSKMNIERSWSRLRGEHGPPGACVVLKVRYQNKPMWADVRLLGSTEMDTLSIYPCMLC